MRIIIYTLCLVKSLEAASLSRPQSVEVNILFFSSSQLSISLASKKNCWAFKFNSSLRLLSSRLANRSCHASSSPEHNDETLTKIIN